MKFSKPWYRPTRGVWYVTIEGTQYNLGPNKEDGIRQYHALMSQPRPKKVAADSVVAVVDAFLDWCQKHRAPHTYEWYHSRLQLFVKTIPPDLKTNQLRPFHVQQWVDSYADLASGSKRNHCRSVQRAMHWAEQQGYIDRSPIGHVEKPAAGKRDTVVSREEFDAILGKTRDRAFRDLLIVSWETGSRPQETLIVEARPSVPSAAKRTKLPKLTQTFTASSPTPYGIMASRAEYELNATGRVASRYGPVPFASGC